MSEYIIELPNGGAADECIRLRGYEKSLYGYELREEIVRCRDCKHYKPYRTHSHGIMDRCYDENGNTHRRDADGFCAWGERDSWTTCKCGESIELGNREFAVCQSCGRMVRE